MKTFMLVGAVGLALAGVAFAASGGSPRLSAETFTSAQKAAVGAAGSAQRAEVLAQLQAGIARGDIDPRTVLFLIDENILPGSGSAVDLTGSHAPTEGVSTLPNVQYFDPYETYTLTSFSDGAGGQTSTALFSFLNQVNPSGRVFTNVDPEIGAADNTTMTEGDNDPLTPPVAFTRGGVAPAAAVNAGAGLGIDNTPPFMVIARASGLDAPNGGFTLGMNIIHDLSVPGGTPDLDSRMKTDWYLTNKKTNQWWSPVSFTEGFVEDRMFFAGQNIGGSLGFGQDAGGFLTNFVSLGVLSGNFQIGQFYAPPTSALFPFPLNEWFEIMAILASAPGGGGGIGQGAFIKTPESIANGFLDPRMAAGTIKPVDNEPAGWVNTYPGIVDSTPAGPSHDGIGIAATQFGQLAPTTGPLGLSSPLAAISLSGLQIGLGLDDTADALFQPDDAFTDDQVLAGKLFNKPFPLPDFIIPYKDHMELYFGNSPVRVQTDRIFDSVSSNAIISTAQNSTPAVPQINPAHANNQSVAQITINNDNLFRIEFGENIPSFPQPVVGSVGADGVPFTGDAGEASLVANAKVRVGVTVRTGRIVRIFDGALSGNFVGTIILGGTNPRAGLAAADGRVWIRQPNVGSNNTWGTPPGFDSTKEGQDNLTQGNWWPASQWGVVLPALAAGENDFNDQFTNIPTGAAADGSDGVAVVPNAFTDILVEAQPNPGQDPNNPFDEGLMRISINGAVVSNPARADGLWLAGGFSAGNAFLSGAMQFWSSNNPNGQGDTIHVDDIVLSGPLRVRPAGPAFAAPYADGFELYNRGEPIGGQGDTPFLDLGSLADNPGTDNARTLTISTNPPPTLVAGVTKVCRYQVDTVALAGGPFVVGDTVAMDFSDLPLPFNTLPTANTDCPGVLGVSLPYVLRPFNGTLGTAENQPRIQTGKWTLLTGVSLPPPFPSNQNPELYDPAAHPTDIINLSYSTTTIARWGGFGTDSLVVLDPTGIGGALVSGGNVLQIESTFGVDGSLNNNPDFFAASALLPQVDSVGGPISTSNKASISVDFYIESLDATGAPDSTLAPRSRMSLAYFGAGPNAGAITTINFGGPNVNNDVTLQGPPVIAPIIADADISYQVDSGIAAPDSMFVDTGVNLVTGAGAGFSGSLLNKWITGTLDVDAGSAWTFSIDEDRAGPLAPIVIASGLARELGAVSTFGVVNTSNLDSIQIRQGRDVGSGGEPIPNNFRIRTLVNNATVTNPQTDSADVTAPSNADKDLDYCFYETTFQKEFEINPVGGPPNIQIADEGLVTDVFDIHRDLTDANDVIAVVNRAYNSTTNTVSGALLYDPCPLNITSPINRVDIYDGPTPANGILYTGRWNLLGQVGQAGTNDPVPAGGLGRIDGPARTIPVSYNDFTVEPPGFPATLASRPIVVCQWGKDATDDGTLPGSIGPGVDGFGTVFPRSKWFFDNLSLKAKAACPDLNGDNAINAADLAILLGNWGPCP